MSASGRVYVHSFFGRKSVKNFAEAKACDTKAYGKFFKALFEKGIYISPLQFEANFVSTAHSSKSLAFTRDAILEVLSCMS